MSSASIILIGKQKEHSRLSRNALGNIRRFRFSDTRRPFRGTHVAWNCIQAFASSLVSSIVYCAHKGIASSIMACTRVHAHACRPRVYVLLENPLGEEARRESLEHCAHSFRRFSTASNFHRFSCLASCEGKARLLARL